MPVSSSGFTPFYYIFIFKYFCLQLSFSESDNQQNLQHLTDNKNNHNETHRGHISTTEYPIMDDVIETEEVHSRSKRSAYSLGKTIREYTIEVLVAVDKKMQDKHRENLQEYVLTLMSTVSTKLVI